MIVTVCVVCQPTLVRFHAWTVVSVSSQSHVTAACIRLPDTGVRQVKHTTFTLFFFFVFTFLSTVRWLYGCNVRFCRSSLLQFPIPALRGRWRAGRGVSTTLRPLMDSTTTSLVGAPTPCSGTARKPHRLASSSRQVQTSVRGSGFKSKNTLPFLTLWRFRPSPREGFILEISESYLLIKVNYH